MNRSPRTMLAAAAAAIASTAALAPSAVAAPVTVTGGTTNWQSARSYGTGLSTTWLGYVLSNPMRPGAAQGSVTAAAGAELVAPDGATRLTQFDYNDAPTESLPTTLWNVEFDATGGTVDVATGEADVTATGSVRYWAHAGVMDITIENPRIKLNADGTGGVYAGGSHKEGVATEPIDNTKPLFTLDASKSAIAAVGGGKVAITNLVPTMGEVEYFGSNYKAGIAGPDRTPNTFGGFSLLVSTANVAPNERQVIEVEKVVEKIVQVPTIVEKIVTVEKLVPVEKKQVVTTASLTKSPFGKSAITVDVAKQRSKDVLGEGFVIGKKLTVVVADGTKLEGKYKLTRTSGSKKGKKSSTVTIAAKKSKKSNKSGK